MTHARHPPASKANTLEAKKEGSIHKDPSEWGDKQAACSKVR